MNPIPDIVQCNRCGKFLRSPEEYTIHTREEPNCIQLSVAEIELSKRNIHAEHFDKKQQIHNRETMENRFIGFGEEF